MSYLLLVAFYYHFSGQTNLTKFRLICGLTVFLGVALALSVDISSVSMLGLSLAFMGGIFATIMIIAVIKISSEIGGVLTNFYLSLGVMLIFTVLIIVNNKLQLPETELGWISCLGNGIAFITAYLTFLLAAGLIRGQRTAMLSFGEPITTILLASIILGEQLSLVQWFGVALVAVGICTMEAPHGTWRRLKMRMVQI